MSLSRLRESFFGVILFGNFGSFGSFIILKYFEGVMNVSEEILVMFSRFWMVMKIWGRFKEVLIFSF